MGIAVLGPLQVDGGADALARRDRVVLAVLAMRTGELVSADQLAEALWAEGPPPTWNKALQGSVVRLRKLLGAPTIETVDHGYRLALPSSDVDAREFERLVGRARELVGLGESERAAYVLGEALALWRGAPLPDLEEWGPGRAEADRLQELCRDAEELRVDALMRSGRHREVLSEARHLAEQAPLRERRWELLALAQYRSGQQADALRTLQQLRRVLVSELGLDPGQEATALEQAILRQDPALLPRIAVADPSDTCPYLGLRAVRRRGRGDVLRPRGRRRGVSPPAGQRGGAGRGRPLGLGQVLPGPGRARGRTRAGREASRGDDAGPAPVGRAGLRRHPGPAGRGGRGPGRGGR